MTTLVGSVGATKKAWQWITIGGALLLLWAGIALPNVMRSQLATNANAYRAAQESLPTINKPLHLYAYKTTDASVSPESPAIDRRIIRTSSLSMVVERPAEVADKITALA